MLRTPITEEVLLHKIEEGENVRQKWKGGNFAASSESLCIIQLSGTLTFSMILSSVLKALS